MELNATLIKTILMQYYRFTRGIACCDEVRTDSYELADVLLMQKSGSSEIEIKVNKYDLTIKESKKKKHKIDDEKRLVNKFFICVPLELKEIADEWVEKTNKKYGIITVDKEKLKNAQYHWKRVITIYKKAQKLNNKSSEYLNKKFIMRLSSALTNEYVGKFGKQIRSVE